MATELLNRHDQRHERTALKEHHEVARAAIHRLSRSGYAAHQQISCDFHEGVLTLRGKVSSYYLKQIAQELLQRLERVVEIANRIEVETSR